MSINKNLAFATLAFKTVLLPEIAVAKNSGQDIKKPNVLMIVVDDWGAKDLSLAGSKFYETPNIDKLAGESFSFSNAYNAYPRSVPSRFSLWTGMHCARPQIKKDNDGDGRKIDKNTLCVAEPFKTAGYNTFFIGKWHLATKDCLPQDKGFEINIGGGECGATSSHFAPFNKNWNPNDPNGGGDAIYGMDDATTGEYLTDYMTRKTVDYIKSKHTKPFFAAVAFYAVHTPLQAKKEIIDKYDKKKITMGITADSYIPEEAGVRKALQNNAVYAAMVQSVDEGIGNIVKALKENGQYENTIIVLVSDNGGLSNRGAGNKREMATNNDPYRAGKGHLYEGGIKTPLLIHLPNQTKASTSDVFTAGYDLFPTLAELCNVKVDKKLDGVSLAPVLKGKVGESLTNRALYWHKVMERPTQTGDYVSSAIRSGDYKLIDFYLQKRVELYNIKNDISETNNLIDKEPEIAAKLMADLNAWRQKMDVNMMTINHSKKTDNIK